MEDMEIILDCVIIVIALGGLIVAAREHYKNEAHRNREETARTKEALSYLRDFNFDG